MRTVELLFYIIKFCPVSDEVKIFYSVFFFVTQRVYVSLLYTLEADFSSLPPKQNLTCNKKKGILKIYILIHVGELDNSSL